MIWQGIFLQVRQCDKVRIYYLQFDTADTHSLQTKLFGTLKTRRKLGRVFRKDFWEILLGGTSPVTIPETTAGHNSAPVLFSFLQWRIVKGVGLIIGV